MAGMIEIERLRFAWNRAAGYALAVEVFALAPGERVLLVGPSGSGKSTLLGLIAGTLVPTEGRITVAGTDLAGLSGPARDAFRAGRLGVIFQQFNLLPYLSVEDNVLLPLRFSPERRRRIAGPPGEEVRRLLAAVGLGEADLARRPAANLSVGQQQRVAAARALIGRPSLILADEPTSALDRARAEDFLCLLSAEAAAAGASVLTASHDTRLAPQFDRTVALADIARGDLGERDAAA